MCCILFCLSHPDFGLVLISNRDEYLKRPTAPSQWHSFPSPSQLSTEGSPSTSIAHHTEQSSSSRNVLSGLDAHPSGGGTWLGLTRSGRIAATTNYTEAAPPPFPQGRNITSYRSRGTLVKDWLKDKKEMKAYIDEVTEHMDEWPGFNLLVGQIEVNPQSSTSEANMCYVSNRSGEKEAVHLTREGSTGSNGLSNSCFQQPWNKVKRGRSMVDEALSVYDGHRREGIDKEGAEDSLSKELFTILESKVTITERSDFVRSIQIPPVRLVQDAWYATRTATVLLIRRDGLVRWWERDIYVLSEQGEPTQGEEMQLSPRYYEWQIEKET